MFGKWIYLGLGALSAVLASLNSSFLSFFFLLLLIIRIKMDGDRRIYLLFSLVFVIFAGTSLSAKLKTKSAYSSPDFIQIQTSFLTFPQIDGNRLQAPVITNNNEKMMLSYRIKSKEEKEELKNGLKSGQKCSLKGRLKEPPKKRNEFLFDYKLFLKRQNIHWTFEPDDIPLHMCSSKISIRAALHQLRESGIRQIEETFPKRAGGYAIALIFGERAFIPEEVDQAYKRLGIVHLLAISGLHIGIIAGGFFLICIRIGLTRDAVFWLLFLFLPAYAVISGGNPPVIRAALMAILLLAAKKWRLPITTLDAISISMILFLLFDPNLVFNIGFQLSYAVSFAIILSSPRVLSDSKGWMNQMFKLSAISLLASFPVLSFHFHEFSLISLIANLFFIPFYTVFLLPAVFLLFFLSYFQLPFIPNLAKWLDKILTITEKVASHGSSLPFAALITGKPAVYVMMFMVLGVLIYFILSERKICLFKSALPIILILSVYGVGSKFSPFGEVVFIDVGQGDSILIELPFNRGTYLIDTGGQIDFEKEEWMERKKPFNVGKNILLPVLKSRGINRIDKLILTHSDADHMGAAKELIGEVAIKKVYISPNSWQKPIMADFVRRASAEKIEIVEVQAGEGWINSSGEFQFIYPFDDHYEGNNDSLVLFANFGGLTWLFTGDVEQEGEEEMAAVYKNLKADVLKAGHHGSRTSTSSRFVEMLKPEVAAISAGESNRYGHPHPEVIETLSKHGVTILRTDQHGAIHYRFTSRGGTFKTILPYDIQK